MLLNNKHHKFRDAVKHFKNLAVRILSISLIGRNMKLRWQSAMMATDPVPNIFIKHLVTVNSRELISRVSRGQASAPYNNIGKHFERIKATTQSAEALRPTLL